LASIIRIVGYPRRCFAKKQDSSGIFSLVVSDGRVQTKVLQASEPRTSLSLRATVASRQSPVFVFESED